MKKKVLGIITILIIVVSTSALSIASSQIINTTGIYIAGASESLNDAKQNALKEAMRQATEQAGVMVGSFSRTHNMELTDDEIVVVASKIIRISKKHFDVELITDSQIKVIAQIEALIDTDSINEDILKLKKQNSLLVEENKKLVNNDKVREKAKKLSSDIRSYYYDSYSAIGKNVRDVKTVPSTDYQTCISRFYVHMGKMNYDDSLSDIIFGYSDYLDKKGVLNKDPKYITYYMDDITFKFYMMKLEYYIAQEQYESAYATLLDLAIKLKESNFMPKNNNEISKLENYGKIITEYLTIFNHKSMISHYEWVKKNGPSLLI